MRKKRKTQRLENLINSVKLPIYKFQDRINRLESKHLVSYSIDQMVDGLQKMKTWNILEVLTGSSHVPSLSSANLGSSKQLEKMVGSLTIGFSEISAFQTPWNLEYDLVEDIKGATWSALWCYIRELEERLTPEKKAKHEELRTAYEKRFSEYKHFRIYEHTVLYGPILSNEEGSLCNEPPIQNIRDIPHLMSRLNKLHGSLTEYAKFIESMQDLPPFMPYTRYAWDMSDKKFASDRAYLFYAFHSLAFPEYRWKQDFFKQSLGLWNIKKVIWPNEK